MAVKDVDEGPYYFVIKVSGPRDYMAHLRSVLKDEAERHPQYRVSSGVFEERSMIATNFNKALAAAQRLKKKEPAKKLEWDLRDVELNARLKDTYLDTGRVNAVYTDNNGNTRDLVTGKIVDEITGKPVAP